MQCICDWYRSAPVADSAGAGGAAVSASAPASESAAAPRPCAFCKPTCPSCRSPWGAAKPLPRRPISIITNSGIYTHAADLEKNAGKGAPFVVHVQSCSRAGCKEARFPTGLQHGLFAVSKSVFLSIRYAYLATMRRLAGGTISSLFTELSATAETLRLTAQLRISRNTLINALNLFVASAEMLQRSDFTCSICREPGASTMTDVGFDGILVGARRSLFDQSLPNAADTTVIPAAFPRSSLLYLSRIDARTSVCDCAAAFKALFAAVVASNGGAVGGGAGGVSAGGAGSDPVAEAAGAVEQCLLRICNLCASHSPPDGLTSLRDALLLFAGCEMDAETNSLIQRTASWDELHKLRWLPDALAFVDCIARPYPVVPILNFDPALHDVLESWLAVDAPLVTAADKAVLLRTYPTLARVVRQLEDVPDWLVPIIRHMCSITRSHADRVYEPREAGAGPARIVRRDNPGGIPLEPASYASREFPVV